MAHRDHLRFEVQQVLLQEFVFSFRALRSCSAKFDQTKRKQRHLDEKENFYLRAKLSE